MRADIHYGQEHHSSTHGPDTEVQDQSLHRHIGLATHGRSIQIGSSLVNLLSPVSRTRFLCRVFRNVRVAHCGVSRALRCVCWARPLHVDGWLASVFLPNLSSSPCPLSPFIGPSQD